MSCIFYLDQVALDELSCLYMDSLMQQGAHLYSSQRIRGFGYTPMPSFDAATAGASWRARWYMHQQRSVLERTAQEPWHLFGLSAVLALAGLSKRTQPTTAYVTTVSPNLPSSYKHRLAHLGENITVAVPSKTIADILQSWGVLPNSLKVELPPITLPTSQAPSIFKGFTSPGFMVGVVCSLAAEQGLETVIQAVQQSIDIIPDLNLFIIGDGPDKRRFQWLIDQTHLKEHVHIAANSADYHRFLQHLEICIAPAVHDQGCDPVVLQSRAHGVAVVATDIPSHAEFIEHGKSGLLYAVGNSHMLSQHLINLYTHRDWLEHYKKIGPVLAPISADA